MKRARGHVDLAAGLRCAGIDALADVMGAAGGRAHERPHLLDAVDVEVAGVLDLAALEAVQRIDVHAEVAAGALEDARQHRAALVERRAGQAALGQLRAIVLELVVVDVDDAPAGPTVGDLSRDLPVVRVVFGDRP